MDADAQKAQQLFSSDHRYLVPAYQRPYVWKEDDQWRPLWEDIERLADARLDDEVDNHFLGTIVLKPEKSAPGGLSEWTVIDGQQRLTTLQIILSALSYCAKSDGLDDIAIRSRSFILHETYKAEGDDRFRFWPTTINQASYKNVMREEGPDLSQDDSENTVEEAWVFFRDQIKEYVSRGTGEIDLEYLGQDTSKEEALSFRYGAIHDALVGMIEVVTIQINEGERPQVVFETLNARGTPLLATDLIKNALFEKAGSEGLDIDEIHEKYWQPGLGDHKYWSIEETMTKVTAPRSEVFLVQWLSMKTGKTASPEAVFDRFRKTFLDAPDSPPVEDLMNELLLDANLMRGIADLDADSPEGLLARRMQLLGSSAFRPLFLLLLKLRLNDEGKKRAFGALESFLTRRAIVRLQSGGYSKLNSYIISSIYQAIEAKAQQSDPSSQGVSLDDELSSDGREDNKLEIASEEPGNAENNLESLDSTSDLLSEMTGAVSSSASTLSSQELAEMASKVAIDEVVITRLISSQASFGRWPTNEEVMPALSEQPLYGTLGRSRIFDLLSEIEITRRKERQSEQINELSSNLHIEHVMPQSWSANWPLDKESSKEDEDNRSAHIHLLGNLTLIAGSLNVSISNSSWEDKRNKLNQNSVLLLNKDLEVMDTWNEEAIERRSQDLAREVLKRWPGPEYYLPESWVGIAAEISPEGVEDRKVELKRIYKESPDKLKALLLNLSKHPDEKRTYADIEQDLGWNKGTIASVYGAYSRYNQNSRRPFRIALNEKGAWTMWMDGAMSAVIIQSEAESTQNSIEQKRSSIQNKEVEEILDSFEEIVLSYPNLSCKIEKMAVYKSGRQVFNGYFAKDWLFLWISSEDEYKTDDLYQFLKDNLSKPEEVKRSEATGNIRLHIVSREELRFLLDLL
jgi:hypothetical protein